MYMYCTYVTQQVYTKHVHVFLHLELFVFYLIDIYLRIHW